MVKIVIVQTAARAFDACTAELKKSGLVGGTDFALVKDTESARAEIIPGEAQLLITGTLHGNEEDARSFAREMKEVNPSLKVAIFSAVEIGGEPFDFCIRKTQIDRIAQLPVEMRSFLESSKNRLVVA